MPSPTAMPRMPSALSPPTPPFSISSSCPCTSQHGQRHDVTLRTTLAAPIDLRRIHCLWDGSSHLQGPGGFAEGAASSRPDMHKLPSSPLPFSLVPPSSLSMLAILAPPGQSDSSSSVERITFSNPETKHRQLHRYSTLPARLAPNRNTHQSPAPPLPPQLPFHLYRLAGGLVIGDHGFVEGSCPLLRPQLPGSCRPVE